MQMTGKLEETKSKAAIINRTKRRLGGAEQEFKAGMGNFGGDGGEKEARNNNKKPNTRCPFFRPRKNCPPTHGIK